MLIYGYSLRAYTERKKIININTNVVIFRAIYILLLLSCDTMKNGIMTTYVVTVVNIIIFIITFIKMVILTITFCWILVGPYSYKYETFFISE